MSTSFVLERLQCRHRVTARGADTSFRAFSRSYFGLFFSSYTQSRHMARIKIYHATIIWQRLWHKFVLWHHYDVVNEKNFLNNVPGPPKMAILGPISGPDSKIDPKIGIAGQGSFTNNNNYLILQKFHGLNLSFYQKKFMKKVFRSIGDH